MLTLKDLAHVSHRWACEGQFRRGWAPTPLLCEGDGPQAADSGSTGCRLADACLTGKCGAQSHMGSLSARAIKSSLSSSNALEWYYW